MASSKWIAGIVGVVLVIALLFSFGSEQGDSPWTSTVTLKKAFCAPAVEAKESALAGIHPAYEKEIQPLGIEECARCHFSVFNALRKQGFRHRIECVRCHREFHVYNPRKNNFDEIMPDCIWCHKSGSGGPFHGDHKNLTPCLNCHADPHKPLNIPMEEASPSCALCHTEEGGEIQDFPSKHTTEVACADCHADKHGHIPECSVCHESHSPGVEMATRDCMTCHPVHKPTEMAYNKETQSTICAGCHDEVYDMLQEKVTKHTTVTCADCHQSHAEIPLCSMCHGEPHPKEMKATNCGECHGIAHDLLV
jgi:predicted CXXCH cytochrome family protein